MTTNIMKKYRIIRIDDEYRYRIEEKGLFFWSVLFDWDFNWRWTPVVFYSIQDAEKYLKRKHFKPRVEKELSFK